MFEISLNGKQQKEITKSIHSLIIGEVEKVRKEANLTNKEWMNKREASDFLGVSFQKFNQFILEGLPSHTVAGMVRFNKNELTKFMLSK